jgi:ADP-ribose pyrophosphatase
MWKTLSSKIIHKNPWWRLVHDKFKLPNGRIGDYFIVHTDGSAMVVPLTKDGKIILVEQYRYPIKKWNLELPAGGVKKGASPAITAREELEEETGYRSKNMKLIGSFVPYMGVSTEVCKVFLAKDLFKTKTNHEDTENIKLKIYSIRKVYQLVEAGKIIDGMTLATLILAKKYLKKYL